MPTRSLDALPECNIPPSPPNSPEQETRRPAGEGRGETGDGEVPEEELRAGAEESVEGGSPAVARRRHHRQEPQAPVPERRRPRQARAGRVHPQDHPG